MLVIHENRGVTEHIRDVVRRAATAGFTALTIDLLSRKGGADGLGDTYSAEIAKTTPDAMVADLKAALDFLKAQSSVKGDALAVTGFCFGGGMVWSLLAAGGDVKAAAPFYGPIPQSPTGLATTKAAVSAVYAETDTRITSTAPQIEDLLKNAGRPYKLTTYPGVGHAFHNDTGNAYNADQAQKAWLATIQWFRQYAV
jgi:carboxymethylenebutenolidase